MRFNTSHLHFMAQQHPVMILILLLAEIAPVKLNELVYFAESGTEISLAVRSFDVTTTLEPSGA